MHLSKFIHKKLYEKLIKVVRRHPVTFVPYIVIFLFLAAVPIGVVWLITSISPGILESAVLYPIGVLFFSTYYLSLCLFFYSYFVAFYLDMWIITNDRLVDVRQISLFARSVAELDLYQVQDATSEVIGFFPSLFNYGTLKLQTAGPVPQFIIHNASRPHELRQLILDLAAEDRKYHNGK